MAVPQIIIYALNQYHALYLFHVFLDELTDFLAVVRVYHGYLVKTEQTVTAKTAMLLQI